MEIIFKAVSSGEYATPESVHSSISYTCTYGAIRVSLRFLEQKGFIKRIGTGSSQELAPTSLAYETLKRM